MDVESKQTIADSIAGAQTAADEVVDRAVAALAVLLKPAITQLLNGFGNTASSLLVAAEKLADSADSDVTAIIAGLDGWTLEIAPITIRLSKPK
jgi:hypothetical protein